MFSYKYPYVQYIRSTNVVWKLGNHNFINFPIGLCSLNMCACVEATLFNCHAKKWRKQAKYGVKYKFTAEIQFSNTFPVQFTFDFIVNIAKRADWNVKSREVKTKIDRIKVNDGIFKYVTVEISSDSMDIELFEFFHTTRGCRPVMDSARSASTFDEIPFNQHSSILPCFRDAIESNEIKLKCAEFEERWWLLLWYGRTKSRGIDWTIFITEPSWRRKKSSNLSCR